MFTKLFDPNSATVRLDRNEAELKRPPQWAASSAHPVRSQPAHPGFRKSDQSVECFGAEASRLAACGRD